MAAGRQDRPLASYQELCRELAASGPGTFGELDTIGARSVLRRYSGAWFAAGAVPALAAGADAAALVPGAEPDPGRIAGVDLGIIHPYAVAGPDGEGLPVSASTSSPLA